MKALITGSRGYIGSVMMKTLCNEGYNPIGVDINVNELGSKRYGENLTLNINQKKIIDIISKHNIDTIFHLAASADVGLSVTNPELFYYNNVGNTSALLTNLADMKWKGNIIFSSTAAVYKEDDKQVSEESVIDSPNPYGRSKLACEWMLKDFSDIHDINVTVFRYFNVAGAWDDCGDHYNAGHIITRLCNAAYHDRNFTLNGVEKKTLDGTCIRDYLHVRDVCDAHLHAMKYTDGDKFKVFNLGTSKGWSNKQIVDSFKRFTGKNLKIINGPNRPGDPDHLVSNAIKFVEKTGYRYNHSSMENIMNTAWLYYSNMMEKRYAF